MSSPEPKKSCLMDPPHYNKCCAYVFFILNIFFPGFGTFFAGLFACSCKTMLVAILQIISAVVIVGWVWAILWGWELVKTSGRK
eukprot:jgi/Undpi1/5299/HiC_scaffold_2.g00580.m1